MNFLRRDFVPRCPFLKLGGVILLHGGCGERRGGIAAALFLLIQYLDAFWQIYQQVEKGLPPPILSPEKLAMQHHDRCLRRQQGCEGVGLNDWLLHICIPVAFCVISFVWRAFRLECFIRNAAPYCVTASLRLQPVVSAGRRVCSYSRRLAMRCSDDRHKTVFGFRR